MEQQQIEILIEALMPFAQIVPDASIPQWMLPHIENANAVLLKLGRKVD